MYGHFDAETTNQVLLFESAPSFSLLPSSEFANELRWRAHINLDISSSFLFVVSFNDGSVHHHYEMAQAITCSCSAAARGLNQMGAHHEPWSHQDGPVPDWATPHWLPDPVTLWCPSPLPLAPQPGAWSHSQEPSAIASAAVTRCEKPPTQLAQSEQEISQRNQQPSWQLPRKGSSLSISRSGWASQSTLSAWTWGLISSWSHRELGALHQRADCAMQWPLIGGHSHQLSYARLEGSVRSHRCWQQRICGAFISQSPKCTGHRRNTRGLETRPMGTTRSHLSTRSGIGLIYRGQGKVKMFDICKILNIWWSLVTSRTVC